MNIITAISLLEAVTKLLGILIWPAVVVFILIRFGSSIRDFVDNITQFSFKGAGIEATGERKQAAAKALAAASVARTDSSVTPEATARDAREAFGIVADAVTANVLRRARQSVVLWVDDHPQNNFNERKALRAIGVDFVIAISTDEALEMLKRQSFDAIISDMERPPDPRAGYTLLDAIRKLDIDTPYILYTSSRSPEHQAESCEHGAWGCTNRPNELFEMVLSALGR